MRPPTTTSPAALVLGAAAVVALLAASADAAFRYDAQQIWPMLSGSQCGGLRQSPIDLDLARVGVNATLGEQLQCSWAAEDARLAGTLFNNGHTIELRIDTRHGCRGVPGQPADTQYRLDQLHLHWGNTTDGGSEHTINGRRSALELHMVHYNANYADLTAATAHADGLMVVGVLFDVDDESFTNPELAKLAILTATSVKAVDVDRDLELGVKGLIAGSGLELNHQRFLTYSGSLTTPNCLEVVTWLVAFRTPRIGRDTLQLLNLARDAVQGVVAPNNRATQARNGRPVTMSFAMASTAAEVQAVAERGAQLDATVIAGLVIGAVAAVALVGLLIVQVRKRGQQGAAYEQKPGGAVVQVKEKSGAPEPVQANGPQP